MSLDHSVWNISLSKQNKNPTKFPHTWNFLNSAIHKRIKKSFEPKNLFLFMNAFYHPQSSICMVFLYIKNSIINIIWIPDNFSNLEKVFLIIASFIHETGEFSHMKLLCATLAWTVLQTRFKVTHLIFIKTDKNAEKVPTEAKRHLTICKCSFLKWFSKLYPLNQEWKFYEQQF